MNSEQLADQALAATREARESIGAALGFDAQPSERGTSPLFEALWDAYGGADRCEHIHARPIQPWLMIMPFPGWRCRKCAASFAISRRGTTLGPIEEFTCDHCRRYSRALTPTIARQDFWTIVLSLCARCSAMAKQQGATELNPTETP